MTAAVLPVWWDDAADGPTNMAADELLADEAARHGGLVIRIYSWSKPSVSLGAFQPLAEADACAAIAGLPLVRRPSGGGAIVHGTDLTYAAAVPKTHPWGATPQALYDAMHTAMVAVLAANGMPARLHQAAATDPPADAFLCFARRSAGDLVAPWAGGHAAVGDPKIMGSAQRRLGTTVLQHGSLLLAANRAVGEEARLPGLAELLGRDDAWEPRQIAAPWLDAIARTVGAAIDHQPGALCRGRESTIDAHARRFRDRQWTARR
ncbi:MAG: hypothetical protein K8S94_17365 [Planctomycetia bacterium]|nr:hypothetical protein [Planctomycetia bacterium]